MLLGFSPGALHPGARPRSLHPESAAQARPGLARRPPGLPPIPAVHVFLLLNVRL